MRGADKFRKGDLVVFVGSNTMFVRKGGIYEVLGVPKGIGVDCIEIWDESGDRDIYLTSQFEYAKSHIINQILNEL